ncbi:hypothetical protein KIN20_011781 [Parelaphostrongylus tenuis]|uniref:Uncharacterized protein n=1 Tax=Parelaphostrongylus tenuis TaxID=148309 RepID=A0AAD5QMA7_PARTN|nr:hypothetical protein KIN20_011781 [Parelaphostrongylus tenuis]
MKSPPNDQNNLQSRQGQHVRLKEIRKSSVRFVRNDDVCKNFCVYTVTTRALLTTSATKAQAFNNNGTLAVTIKALCFIISVIPLRTVIVNMLAGKKYDFATVANEIINTPAYKFTL